jgi:hypothetical protein
MPFVTPEITEVVEKDEKQVPPGERVVRRGTRVEATDGYVGHIDEFVINLANGYITHLVVREGHLWGKKDIIVPLAAMGDTRDKTVYLMLTKHQVEFLPTFVVHREGGVEPVEA